MAKHWIVLIGFPAELEEISARLELPPSFVLLPIAVGEKDWNDRLSPYPCEKVFPKGASFLGQAEAFLSEIQTRLRHELALAEEKPASIIIAGYSLAGLFALYAAFESNLFDAAVSCSGSLWFPGFVERYPLGNKNPNLTYVYLSLGEDEAKTKNPILATIQTKTAAFQTALEKQGIVSDLTFHPGGHFADPNGRMVEALTKIITKKLQVS